MSPALMWATTFEAERLWVNLRGSLGPGQPSSSFAWMSETLHRGILSSISFVRGGLLGITHEHGSP